MELTSRFATVTSSQPITVHHSSVQSLLLALLRSSLILPDEWSAVSSPTQMELEGLQDPARFLERLVELRLLTEYQAGRISAGAMKELLIGNYRVLDHLGAGGMGTVLKGEHRMLRRPVAIKVIHLEPVEDAQSLERFLNEMRSVAQLNHPNIAAALDAGDEVGNNVHAGRIVYFVMEYVQGQDLDAYVQANGPLDPALACDLAFQIASALEEAHEHHLVHRDIKPSNIRLTPENQVKLLDFGIARNIRNRLTIPGTLLGSVAFLAPEQATDSSSVDIRADIYALGGTLFWCLTGQYPFPSVGNVAVEVARRATQSAPAIRSIRPDIPAALEAVIQTMMAPKAENRYANPKEVRQALFPFLKPGSQALDGQVIPFELEGAASLRPTGPPSARAHRILIVDDEAPNRSLFSMVLTISGLHCQVAASGALALEALRAQPFDLVILDIDMPQMKGTEVLRRLREAPPVPHLKIIMVSGRATPDDMAQLLLAGADDYLAKPLSSSQLQARVKTALYLKDAQDRSDKLHRNLLGANLELEKNLQARDGDLIHARNALVLALAELVAYRDHETGDHLLRLQRFTGVLAQTAATAPSFAGQIDANFVNMLECCAPLHDIGKVGLPDYILLKPGKLTPEEIAIMRMHTTIGAELLQKVAIKHGFARTFLEMATDITRHHHERFDGTGYPDGLAGEAIPLAARIVSIADVYDALRSRRIYKPALPHTDVVRIMVKESEGQFDPALVNLFQRCSGQFEQLHRDLLDSQ